MGKAQLALLFVALAALAVCSGCSKEAGTPVSSAAIDAAKLRLFEPLPEIMVSKNYTVTEEKIGLGRTLYYETRLSRSQEISCNSCHLLDKYGVDGQPTSDGHKGLTGDRNSPSVYNAAGHFVQFWDGRAADVEEQAKGPMMNPIEMAIKSPAEIVVVLKSMPEYVEGFKKAFPEEKDPVTYENAAMAIGAFERKLVTPSRWDKFLRGDQTALTADEKSGFNTYIATGCQTCHAGTYLGGNLYQKLGVAKPWPDRTDPGRARVTHNDADQMIFKVPSLRNIEKTGPYYHNGKISTLEEAITTMADYQLGKSLSPEQVQSIGAYLRSLTGEIPVDYVKEPPLPKATEKTPGPDLSE